MSYARGKGFTCTKNASTRRAGGGENSISILPFDPCHHNKSFKWLTKESCTLLLGQMNLAMENSNNNAGDLLKGEKRKVGANGLRIKGGGGDLWEERCEPVPKRKLQITAGQTINIAASVLICTAAAVSVSLIQKRGECQKEEEEQDKGSWKRLDETCGVERAGDCTESGCRLVKAGAALVKRASATSGLQYTVLERRRQSGAEMFLYDVIFT